jgi:hypothetical protein
VKDTIEEEYHKEVLNMGGSNSQISIINFWHWSLKSLVKPLKKEEEKNPKLSSCNQVT